MRRLAESSSELAAEVGPGESRGAGQVVDSQPVGVTRVGNVLGAEQVAGGRGECHRAQYCRRGKLQDTLRPVPLAIRLLLALGINAAALWVADVLFSGVRIHGWWAYIIAAAVLAIANSVIKPILALITLPLIILTLGLFYLVINIAMVALAEWIAPDFSIDGFWSYVGTVAVVWLVNWVGYSLVEGLEGSRRRPSFT
jgi:putative membrane protein